jgi:dimeric dUTPase (all-alpha-NTP-PPase superfamily)
MQKALDDHIIEKKGLQGQDLLPNLILALQVELGECANEWRGFKHWSDDQAPRNVLEEYVDCLHFILSIGNLLVHRSDKTNISFIKNDEDIIWHFSYLFSTFSDLWNYGEIDEPYGLVIKRFLDLGELLGFTYIQIEEAYISKNEVNHERQENGY